MHACGLSRRRGVRQRPLACLLPCGRLLLPPGALFVPSTEHVNAVAAVLQAGAVVQQSVSQMRTVAAYNGEQRALSEYAQHLDMPVKVRAPLCRLHREGSSGMSVSTAARRLVQVHIWLLQALCAE
jgi:hypothetical protein